MKTIPFSQLSENEQKQIINDFDLKVPSAVTSIGYSSDMSFIPTHIMNENLKYYLSEYFLELSKNLMNNSFKSVLEMKRGNCKVTTYDGLTISTYEYNDTTYIDYIIELYNQFLGTFGIYSPNLFNTKFSIMLDDNEEITTTSKNKIYSYIKQSLLNSKYYTFADEEDEYSREYNNEELYNIKRDVNDMKYIIDAIIDNFYNIQKEYDIKYKSILLESLKKYDLDNKLYVVFDDKGKAMKIIDN